MSSAEDRFLPSYILLLVKMNGDAFESTSTPVLGTVETEGENCTWNHTGYPYICCLALVLKETDNSRGLQ